MTSTINNNFDNLPDEVYVNIAYSLDIPELKELGSSSTT